MRHIGFARSIGILGALVAVFWISAPVVAQESKPNVSRSIGTEDPKKERQTQYE